MKHGLLSKEVLLRDEKAEELEELGKRIRSELLPANEIELIMVEKIVAYTWRLKRALRIESQMIDYQRSDGVYFEGGKMKELGAAFSWEFTNYDSYGKFIRYLSSIERGIFRALHELQRLQAKRNGEQVPLPTMVDVDVNTKE